MLMPSRTIVKAISGLTPTTTVSAPRRRAISAIVPIVRAP